MVDCRRSYKKAVYLAVVCGLALMFPLFLWIAKDRVSVLGLGSLLHAPILLAWVIIPLFLSMAVLCFAVAAGGILALHNDSKGRVKC